MLFTCIVAVIHMPDMPDLKLSKQLDDIIKGDINGGHPVPALPLFLQLYYHRF